MYLREEVMMLKKEDYSVIKALAEHGVYQKDIAEKLRVHRKTVSRPLKRGGAPERTRQVKPSKLEPSKPTIDRLLSEGVWNAPGAPADLVVCDYVPPTPLASGNLAGHLIGGVQPSMFTGVMVAGRWVCRDGVPVNIDLDAVSCRARQLATALWRRMRG